MSFLGRAHGTTRSRRSRRWRRENRNGGYTITMSYGLVEIVDSAYMCWPVPPLWTRLDGTPVYH